MGIVQSLKTSIVGRFGAKALEAVKHPGRGGFFLRAAKPQASQMAADIGNGLNANVVLSPIRLIQRYSNEATLALKRAEDDEAVGQHPLLSLLEQPNVHYSGAHLLAATIFSFLSDGNAYWLLEAGIAGRPRSIWYTPHWLIEPQWPDDGSEFINHYKYSPGGMPQKVEIEDVVHFRNGMNPENTRKGLSPLSGLLYEIWTDMEAGSFVGSIMKNGGIPGLLFSPRGHENPMSSADVEELKNYFTSQFSGEGRGRPMVSSVDSRLEQFGFNPSELDLSSVRNVAEERVCAALGVPAAVVGFGTGLQQTKVGATMKELRKEAWIGGILPVLNSLAAEINRTLMPFFQSGDALKFHFDASDVPALAEDRDLVEARILKRVDAGVATVNEGRLGLGLEEADGQDVYLRNFSTIEVPQGTAGRQIESEQAEFEAAAKRAGIFDRKLHDDDDHHTAREREIAQSARKLSSPPAPLRALALQLDVLRASLAGNFESKLAAFFNNLGKTAERAAQRVLGKGGPLIFQKQTEDTVAEQIIAGMNMRDELPIFEDLFEKAYIASAEETAGAMKATLGISVGVADPVARSILATAGRRAGLIDLTKQSKEAAFRSLVQSTAEGLGPEAAARKIRDAVGAGPWGTPATRAKVIARTEMGFATNASSLELGKSFGAQEAVVFDARLGSTDGICEALNGVVVSLEQASGLMSDEHPNGTRSFTPVPPEMKL